MRSFTRTLLAYARHDRGSIGTIVAALLFESAFGALIPVAFGRLIDDAIPRRDMRSLIVILVIVGVGAAIVSVVGVVRDFLYARVQSDILRNMRVAMFERLQRLSLDYFGRTHSGDILSRFSGDLSTVDSALMGAPPWLFLPAFDVLIATVVLFWLHWPLAVLSMLIWPACLLGPRFFGGRATVASDDRKHDEGTTLAAVHENIAAQVTLRIFLLTRDSIRRFAASADRLAASSRRLGFAGAMVERSAGVGINVLRVIVLGVGAAMAFRGDITVGTLASFQAVFLVLSSALSWISQYVPTMLQAAGSMRRVEELLNEEAERSDDDDARAAHGSLQRAIEFRDVTFNYPNGRSGIEALSLRIDRGSSVAIVGPSGSGKSTMLGLLLRLHEPTVGAMRLDDRDLGAGSVNSLRRQIGVVSQDSFLFSASLAENIRLGRPDATDEDVVAAARAAAIHDFIAGLPAAYETRVGEGGMRLSGGQRQRIAIARAFVRNPQILLLDEATSALDAATESAVNGTLREMAVGRTVISVTHRLSSVADADRVFVLNAGRLVEQGTHEELLALAGTYHTLWHKQHGFITGGDDGRIEVTPSRLRRVPLLSALDDATLQELTGMFVIERRPPGTALVYEGEIADKFYIIVRGRVEVTRAAGASDPVVIAILDDGDYFGEMGLLQDVPRNATVRTLSECSCLVLDQERFRGVVARVPQLREELLRRMSKRLSITTQSVPATSSSSP